MSETEQRKSVMRAIRRGMRVALARLWCEKELRLKLLDLFRRTKKRTSFEWVGVAS